MQLISCYTTVGDTEAVRYVLDESEDLDSFVVAMGYGEYEVTAKGVRCLEFDQSIDIRLPGSLLEEEP